MKIPKKLKIGGRVINVVFDKELTNREDVTGSAHYRYEKMFIQPSVEGKPRSEDDIAITFVHELLHFIATYIAEKKLHEEKCLTRLSEALYQVLKDNKLYFGEK